MYVNCPSQETEVTSTPTRPVDNVVITTKGLQDRNIHILDGTTVENKGKLILYKGYFKSCAQSACESIIVRAEPETRV